MMTPRRLDALNLQGDLWWIGDRAMAVDLDHIYSRVNVVVTAAARRTPRGRARATDRRLSRF